LQKILYIDMDGVLVHFDSAFKHFSADTLRKYKGKEDEIPGIFGCMDPMPGAVDAYQELSQLFDTYVLSTAPWENPSAWSDKLLWVQMARREQGGRAFSFSCRCQHGSCWTSTMPAEQAHQPDAPERTDRLGARGAQVMRPPLG